MEEITEQPKDISKAIPRYVFCQKCHVRLLVPKIVLDGKLKVAAGYVNLECNKCKHKQKIKV